MQLTVVLWQYMLPDLNIYSSHQISSCAMMIMSEHVLKPRDITTTDNDLDSFISCLPSLLGYSTGEFQALQLIVLAVLGGVD